MKFFSPQRKRINLFIFSLILFLVGNYSYLECSEVNAKPFRFHSVRKSGTNLVNKLMHIMGVEHSKIYPQIHTDCIDMDQLDSNTNYIIFVRDPRDVFVSFSNYVVNPMALHVAELAKSDYVSTYNFLNSLTLSERIDHFMFGPKLNNEELPNDDLAQYDWIMSYENILNLKARFPDNVHIFRFEDLIGPEFGGNSKEKQLSTIQKIANLCNKQFSKKELLKLSQDMLGKTNTFTIEKNKVGQWKRVLTPKQLDYIKKNFNYYILKFGYERNADWDIVSKK